MSLGKWLRGYTLINSISTSVTCCNIPSSGFEDEGLAFLDLTLPSIATGVSMLRDLSFSKTLSPSVPDLFEATS